MTALGMPGVSTGPEWPGAMLPQFRESHPDRLLGYDALEYTLSLARRFAGDESPTKGRYFDAQFTSFRDAMVDHPDVLGVFRTEYPFYAMKDDGGIYAIAEIDRYIGSFLPGLKLDKARNYGAWICGACDITNDLPDLKQYCRPCTSSDFKPRDIFRALPDLDYWVVTKDTESTIESAQLEKEIQTRAERAGFYSSDKDIVQAVETARFAMGTVLRGCDPGVALPTDMHVVTKSQLLACMQAVPEAVRLGGVVPISPRSLHKVWEETDVPYDYVKDFLFSFTPYGWNDSELNAVLKDTRAATKELIGNDPVAAVAMRAAKEGRQLETAGVRTCLERRVASW